MVAKLIAIDWGSSHFRAYLLNEKGECIAKKKNSCGILEVSPEDYPSILQQECHTWLHENPTIPLIICGMITSRQGWHEVAYCVCPLLLKTLADHLYQFQLAEHQIYLVPGVSYRDAPHFDVMRGEETQILGILNQETSQALVCLPGTHSKWAVINEHKLQQFSTFMTGELFKILPNYSILGQLMSQKVLVDEGFAKGLAYSQQQGDISAHLFSVRAQVLQGAITEDAAYGYLSGLLIGHEIKSALNLLKIKAVNLVADGTAAELYRQALAAYGVVVTTMNVSDATIKGLWALAKMVEIV